MTKENMNINNLEQTLNDTETSTDTNTNIENYPLNKYTIKQVGALMKQLREIIDVMEEAWKSDVATFKLTHEHMGELYKWNQEHLVPPPEVAETDEYGNEIKWDPINGINCITEEKVIEIFGEGHPIIGVVHSITIDRLRDVFEDFHNWTHALAEYRDANNAYIELIDEKERMEVVALEKVMNETEDEGKKKKIQKALNEYWNRIYLEFLTDQIPEDMIKRMVTRLSNENKMSYILDRTVSKMHQMNLSAQFIPEVVKFESTMLDPKYHECDGALLMYFADMITQADVGDRHNDYRNRAIYMIVVLDRLIRNQLNPEVRERVMKNIIAYEDQMISVVPRKESSNNITAPLTDPVYGRTINIVQ